MPKREASIEYYERLWRENVVIDKHRKEIEQCRAAILAGSEKYKKVEQKIRVPWFVVGAIHGMECSFNWKQCLHNGDPWDEVTTHVPSGRGPFSSWEDAAVDALEMKRPIFPSLWTVAETSFFLERYNGLGYLNRGLNSPYLYSYGTAGVGVGKFVEDGRYDANEVSDQAGAMTIFRVMVDRGDIKFAEAPDIYFSKLGSSRFVRYQELLAALGQGVVADGKIGPKTSDAHKAIFGDYLAGDPRRMA